MATHSSVLAWRIPGTGKPGGLPSMGSHRVGHDWHDLAAAARKYLKSLCHSAPSPYPNTKRFYCSYLISTFSPPTACFFFFSFFKKRLKSKVTLRLFNTDSSKSAARTEECLKHEHKVWEFCLFQWTMPFQLSADLMESCLLYCILLSFYTLNHPKYSQMSVSTGCYSRL